jgi:hypothetical protein
MRQLIRTQPIDFEQQRVESGIWETVAGKSNNSFLSQVLAAPGWAGNSGSPVMQIEEIRRLGHGYFFGASRNV